MQCAWLVVVVVVAAVSGQLLSLAPAVSECNTPWTDCGEPSHIAIHTSQGTRPQDSQTLAANLDRGLKEGQQGCTCTCRPFQKPHAHCGPPRLQGMLCILSGASYALSECM